MSQNTNTPNTVVTTRVPLHKRAYGCCQCLDTGIVMSNGERRYCSCAAGKELYRKRCQECGDES